MWTFQSDNSLGVGGGGERVSKHKKMAKQGDPPQSIAGSKDHTQFCSLMYKESRENEARQEYAKMFNKT